MRRRRRRRRHDDGDRDEGGRRSHGHLSLDFYLLCIANLFLFIVLKNILYITPQHLLPFTFTLLLIDTKLYNEFHELFLQTITASLEKRLTIDILL